MTQENSPGANTWPSDNTTDASPKISQRDFEPNAGVKTERSTGKARVIEPTPTAEDLLIRCRRLLSELVAFQDFARKSKAVDIRHFTSSVRSEEKSLIKLAEADQTASRTVHNLRSSNLPFYEAVWATAKASRRLVGLQKKFHWKRASKSTGKCVKKTGIVDVVANDGLLWIKVSTVTEAKLLFEKAKLGWEEDEWAGSSDDGTVPKKVFLDGTEAQAEAQYSEDENEGRMELVKVAHDLWHASLATRSQFKHPGTLIVLPNIQEGVNGVVDGILADIRSAGVDLRCGKQQLSQQGGSYQDMLPIFRPSMTSIINLDCTVLLAFISDLSHGNADGIILPEKPHPSLTYQVEIERASPLLPGLLYPGLLKAERLVTSARSAARMWEIVRIIGTPSERERAHILFGSTSEAAKTAGGPATPATIQKKDLISRLAALSIHDVPPLALPVEIIADGINTVSAVPPKVLGRVSGQLSDINRSVFLLGWTNGWTTVTSNQVAVKIIESTVTDELDKAEKEGLGGFESPLLWSIDVARSLVGKESGRQQ